MPVATSRARKAQGPHAPSRRPRHIRAAESDAATLAEIRIWIGAGTRAARATARSIALARAAAGPRPGNLNANPRKAPALVLIVNAAGYGLLGARHDEPALRDAIENPDDVYAQRSALHTLAALAPDWCATPAGTVEVAALRRRFAPACTDPQWAALVEYAAMAADPTLGADDHTDAVWNLDHTLNEAFGLPTPRAEWTRIAVSL